MQLKNIKKISKNGFISFTGYVTFNTEKRRELIRITDLAKRVVKESGVKEGLLMISPMHITASVFINDNESGLHSDFMEWLEKLAPYDPSGYAHHATGEDNGDAHLKRTIMGRESTVAITEGELDFGPWEEIFYGEFDGQRPKRVLIKIIGLE